MAFGRRAPRAAGGVDSGSLGDHQGPESLDVAVGGAPAASISELSAAEPNSLADAAAARERWRRNGAVSFPALLSTQATKALLERVRAAQHGEHTRDYTQVTRDKTNRVHKALPVSEAEEALVEVARKLGPFLCEVLGADQVALLESGFMVTSPGAATQQFHRDVAPDVVSRSSLTASIQISLVDTAANQGCLEVVPGSQECASAAPQASAPARAPIGALLPTAGAHRFGGQFLAQVRRGLHGRAEACGAAQSPRRGSRRHSHGVRVAHHASGNGKHARERRPPILLLHPDGRGAGAAGPRV